ncbi:sialidase-1-like [Corticium candelabrum]|uniref:sialidase-1-like n=1 Tax=Corticium candelabrum TaxID=121492 RepID=UPI002E252B5B|nr:sialidase-1-like [Corticium candelabrum]
MLSSTLLFVLGSLAVFYPIDAKWRFAPYVEREDVLWRQHDPGDVNEYRIPIIGPTADGHLVAISEARKLGGGDSGNKFLAMLRSDDGVQWSSATKFIFSDLSDVTDGMNLGEMLTDMETGSMFIIYSHCAHACNVSTTYIIRSDDNGLSWKNAVNVTNVICNVTKTFDPGPGLGLQLKHHPRHKGRLIFCGHGGVGSEIVACIYSNDHGETWKGGMALPGIPFHSDEGRGLFEPNELQMIELKDGRVLFTIRNEKDYNDAGPIFASSDDGCETISMMSIRFPQGLPDPVCAAGMLYHEEHDGLLLHSNAYSTRQRINMTVSWSYDEGQTWNNSDHLQVWPGPSAYSCLTAIPGKPNYVGLLYENGIYFRYERITYALINLQPTWEED